MAVRSDHEVVFKLAFVSWGRKPETPAGWLIEGSKKQFISLCGCGESHERCHRKTFERRKQINIGKISGQVVNGISELRLELKLKLKLVLIITEVTVSPCHATPGILCKSVMGVRYDVKCPNRWDDVSRKTVAETTVHFAWRWCHKAPVRTRNLDFSSQEYRKSYDLRKILLSGVKIRLTPLKFDAIINSQSRFVSR